MINLTRYKNYRRIFPKLRLSWSLYRHWINNDWAKVWDYLTGIEQFSNEAMTKGKNGHKYLETNGLPLSLIEILGTDKGESEKRIEIEKPDYTIAMVIDFLTENFVLDYKFGSLSGYEEQLQQYMWGSNTPKGLLVKMSADWTPDWKPENLRVEKTMLFERNGAKIDKWGLVYDEMANSIYYQIHEGELDKFLNNFYF